MRDFEHKMSPLKLGHLAVAVSSRYGDRSAAAAFMDSVAGPCTIHFSRSTLSLSPQNH